MLLARAKSIVARLHATSLLCTLPSWRARISLALAGTLVLPSLPVRADNSGDIKQPPAVSSGIIKQPGSTRKVAASNSSLVSKSPAQAGSAINDSGKSFREETQGETLGQDETATTTQFVAAKPFRSALGSANESVGTSDSLLTDLADRMNQLALSREKQIAQSSSADAARDKPSRFKLKQLPAEPNLTHTENATLHMGPFHEGALVPIALLKPIQLEASYSKPITLSEALGYAMENGLPIKISRESWIYQRWQFAGTLVSALPIPNFGMSYNLTKSDIISNDTDSTSKVFQETLRFPVFQGGAAVYSMLAQYYREKGWKHAYYTSINDAMLDVYQKYTNLELQHVLLQIRAKAVEVSEAQLRLNNSLYLAGATTKLAIMQSRTQLAQDREALIEQQVAVRVAALALAFSLNMPMSVNLIPQTETVTEAPLVPSDLTINQLLAIAVSSRPDLREYELFRLASARNVQVAASAMYPTASFFTSYTNSNTIVTGGTRSGPTAAQLAAANASSNNSGNSNSNGSSSGSSGNSGSGGSNNSNSNSNNNFQNTAAAGVFGGLFNTLQAGFTLSWSLSNLGFTPAINTISAQALARQALLQANQALLLVNEQVRADFSGALAARTRIDNGAYGVVSAREALHLANLRLAAGTGTNIDSIQAQRDYINALVTQAQAIIGSNMAQAQLLHDIGTISIPGLLHGYRPDKPPPKVQP
jgi:outer membrane protein TolC